MHFAGTALTSSREWGEAPAAAAGAHTGLSATGGPTTIILLLGHLLCPRLVVAPPTTPLREMELPVLQWLSSPGLSWHMRCQRAGEYPELVEAACRYGPLFLILVLTFGKVS